MALEPGLSAEVELVVGDRDTAIVIGSGAVPVLATPRVVALCEEATCRALDHHLAPGQTTVGIRVQFDHLRANVVGVTVTASARLASIEGRRLTFVCAVSDPHGDVAVGEVTRVIVDGARFLEQAASQA